MTVYFIQAETGPIKIGHSSNVRSRLSYLQCGTAERLSVIGIIDGAKNEEVAIHLLFSEDKIRGEWYAPTARLLAYIKQYAQPVGLSGDNPAENQIGTIVDPNEVLSVLRSAIQDEGSQLNFARKHNISPPYISDALKGRRDPGEKILTALGLERVVNYRKRGKVT